MRPRHVAILIGAALALAAAPASAHEHDAAVDEKASPALDRLKALAGEWEGTARAPGADKAHPTKASVRVVSGGSAVMLVTDPGTPHEMVTMFHGDDGALVATHYCAAMNQPRMKAAPGGDPAKLAFEFMDGTNLGAHPAHMQRLVVTTAGKDRHQQEWTFLDGGKPATMTMDLERKK
jgi:hypothetical protein